MTSFEVRCPHCSIGTDQHGQNIGGLVSSQDVGMVVRKDKTVLIARIGRCINLGGPRKDGSIAPPCERILSFEGTNEMDKYRITKNSVMNCLQHSRGNLFTLKELQQGFIRLSHESKPHDLGLHEVRDIPKDHNEAAEIDDTDIPF